MTRPGRGGARLALLLLVLISVLAPAFAQRNIYQRLQSDRRFSTVVRAIQETGMDDTLSAPGPYTFFAPTNEAFNRLPRSQREDLLNNRERLLSVLRYHTVQADVRIAELQRLSLLGAMQGSPVMITLPRGGGVVLNGRARIVTNNITATNGVIHAIDNVLLPPTNNVLDVLRRERQFGTFLRLVEAAGLTSLLRDSGPITVFAPTDRAFDALPRGDLDRLQRNRAVLARIIQYHVVPGQYTANDLRNVRTLRTFLGATLRIERSRNVLVINNAVRVTEADIPASNGVIHVVDRVIIPPDRWLNEDYDFERD